MTERTVAVITGNGEVTTRTEAIPELKDNQVLIKVGASLISPGTEMGGVISKRNNPDPDAEAAPFGYANAGEIIEIKGDPKDLKVGMRVTAMGGLAALHANFAAVPVNLVVPIPDDVSYEDASFACLGATALQAIRRTVPELGEYGLVLGLGIVGNLAAQLCQLSGGRTIAWEGEKLRMDIAQRCGISNTVNFKDEDPVELSKAFCAPYGADYAILAFGGNGTPALDQVKSCMKVSADGHAMGRIVLVGGCEVSLVGGAGSGNLDIRSAARTGPGYHDDNYEYGQDYPNAFVQFTTQRNLREIVQLISEKRLFVNEMITHRFDLENVGQAADLLISSPGEALGAILKMSH